MDYPRISARLVIAYSCFFVKYGNSKVRILQLKFVGCGKPNNSGTYYTKVKCIFQWNGFNAKVTRYLSRNRMKATPLEVILVLQW